MKKYFKLIVTMLVVTNIVSMAQNQTKKWYFGATAGLDFMGGPAILTNGVMNPWEGCASIADAAGNLLFYTDGIQVWNKNHIQMPNGFGLFGNGSTTQSGVIVQKPGSATIYYIFTEDAQAAVNGLRYSTVDMSLAGGLGDVIAGSKNTPLFTPSDEKITAVRHCNGVDVWVITHDWNSNNFRTFLVTSAGVGAAVNSAVGTVHNGSNANTIGQMKASPNGRKIALAIHDTPFNAFELYDFNNTTGVVSNPIVLGNTYNWAYGVEFSPDGTKVYGGKYGGGSTTITQWDVCQTTAAAIIASKVQIATPAAQVFAFQLATNGKIYVARIGTNMMGVINAPNTAGVGCNYVDLGQSIAPRNNNLGLPNFITSFLKVPPPPPTYTVNSSVSCLTASFSPPAVASMTSSCASAGYTVTGFNWDFGDPPSGPANTSTLTNPSHTYPGPGTYTTTLIINYNCSADTVKIPVSIISPSVTIATNPASCAAPGSATATPGGGTGPYSYTWTPTGQTTQIATGLTAGIYTVTVKDNGGGCIVTATANLGTVNAFSGTVTTTSVTCNGASTGTAGITVSGGSGTTNYSWTPGGQTTANVTTMAAGIYTVVATDVISGCSVTKTLQITQPPALTLNIAASSSTACAGTSITLTAINSGGTGPVYNYNWIAGPATNTYVVSQAIGGNYTYSVSSADANNCAISKSISVTFITNPVVTASSSTICVGSTATLTSAGATNYTWTPGGVTGNTFTMSPGATTPITILGANGSCTASSTATITVNALPTPTAGNTGPYCPGNTIQLNGSAAATYTWSGPSTFTSNLQSPSIPTATTSNGGVYTFSVTDVNGCKNSVTTNVIVNPNPNPVVGSNSPVCLNSNINLTGNGGTSYSWNGPNGFISAVQNPTVVGATTINAGVYTVTVTSLGCTNTGTVNVIVTTPTTSAANTGPYCAGATIQLNAPAATSYTWSAPGFVSNVQNPTRPASTPAMSGNYTLLVAIGTCTATATTSVTVNALPTPTANNTGPYCPGTTIQFNGSSASTYTWSGPLSYNANGQNPTQGPATTSMSGVYTFSVTDINGCKNSVTTNVVVNPTPTVSANNPTVCLNQTINLTSTGGSAYSWSGPQSYVSAAQNPSIPNAQINMSGVYTVTVTSAVGCTNTAVANVTVYPLPTPAILSNTPCVGGTLNLSGSGGATYQWSGPGYSGPTQNPNVNNVTLATGGTYTLIASAGTCSASTTANITINPLPTPVINSNSPVCIGQAINFTGNGGVNYAWSGPGLLSNSQNPGIAVSTLGNSGNYTLTVTDANGCVNSTSQNVIVNPQPIVNASGASICENASANLSANGGVGYSWSGPGGFTSNAQNPNITSATMANAGQYTVIVTNANTCTNTAVASLTINPAPTPNIQINSPICINNILGMSGGGGISYSWTGPNGFFSTSQTPTVLANTTAYSGNYAVTVTDVNGCSASASMSATINPVPNINIVASNNIGCAPLCVTFTMASSSAIKNYNWNMGDGSTNTTPVSQACYNATGIYTINASLIDMAGCSNSITHTVNIYPNPTADFNYDPINPLEGIDPVHFTDASYGATIANWNWYFMNTAQYTSNIQNPLFTYVDAGEYAVALVVKSINGCIDTVVKSIVVGEDFGIYVPNAFSPNADGLNDLFYAKGFGVKKFEMQIFDRWGEKVFASSDIHDAWDGTIKGKMGKEDAYTWRIKVVNVNGKAKEITGHVTLIK